MLDEFRADTFFQWVKATFGIKNVCGKRRDNAEKDKKKKYSSIFSSTGPRPASYCHGVESIVRPSICPSSVCTSVHPFVRACIHKLFLQKTSPQKLLTGFLRNFTGMFLKWSSFKFLQIIMFYEEFWLPWQSK